MFEAFNILHGENWCALAIAILYRSPVNAEDSFQLYDTGRIERETKQERRAKDHKSLIADMVYMRQQRLTWAEIGQVLGLKAPQKFFAYHNPCQCCVGGVR